MLAVLTACSPSDDAAVRYAEDYANHEPLRVVGYPSTGSLEVTQEIVWRIADERAEGLQSLASSDGTEDETKKTAANWIKEFRNGARGKVTADFYDEGSDRQMVVLYFHDTGQIKDIDVRLDGNGGQNGWRALMREPSPKQVAAVPGWVPRSPGALGSTHPE